MSFWLGKVARTTKGTNSINNYVMYNFYTTLYLYSCILNDCIINVTVFCNFESAVFIVQFQKISIPTLRKVNGNSKGDGISKNDFVKRKV